MTNHRAAIVKIAKTLGSRPDYVQGGGGNISVKIDEHTMAIKASGFRLIDVTEESGLVALNHTPIKEFLCTKHNGADVDEATTQGDTLVKSCVFPNETLRPSIETGFHSLGSTFVAHSHSVYANILNCSHEGKALIPELFPNAAFVNYATPGIPLSLRISSVLEQKYADTIFLENHGLIVTSTHPDETLALHEYCTNQIIESFNIPFPYPKIKLKELAPGKYTSTSTFLSKYIVENRSEVGAINDKPLFPDQMVYADVINFDTNPQAKVHINLDRGEIIYNSKMSEALAFEETFAAWAFLMETFQTLGFTPKFLSKNLAAHITTMESEQYRKQLI